MNRAVHIFSIPHVNPTRLKWLLIGNDLSFSWCRSDTKGFHWVWLVGGDRERINNPREGKGEPAGDQKLRRERPYPGTVFIDQSKYMSCMLISSKGMCTPFQTMGCLKTGMYCWNHGGTKCLMMTYSFNYVWIEKGFSWLLSFCMCR